jgi:hypothetical protein
MKSVIIVAVIAFLLLILLGNNQTGMDNVQNGLQEQKTENLKKRDEVVLKSNNPRMALLVDDYSMTVGTGLDFNADQSNVEKVTQILNEIKEKTGRDAEYKIFTTPKNFVVKLRYVGSEDYICTDSKVINQIVLQSVVDFSAKLDCAGQPL